MTKLFSFLRNRWFRGPNLRLQMWGQFRHANSWLNSRLQGNMYRTLSWQSLQSVQCGTRRSCCSADSTWSRKSGLPRRRRTGRSRGTATSLFQGANQSKQQDWIQLWLSWKSQREPRKDLVLQLAQILPVLTISQDSVTLLEKTWEKKSAKQEYWAKSASLKCLDRETFERYLLRKKLRQRDVGLCSTSFPIHRSSPRWASKIAAKAPNASKCQSLEAVLVPAFALNQSSSCVKQHVFQHH